MLRLSPLIALLILGSQATAQDATIRGHIDVIHHSKHESGSADVVVWLTPDRAGETPVPKTTARLVQKNKRFSPHVVAVAVGSEIEFPNQDPFFHDVFSIYRGKPFDLGLYESGAVRKVRFSQPGVSYLFCNIHPEMSAAVIALPTSHFAVTAPNGNFQIAHVPAGHYKLEVWYELASDTELSSLARDLDVLAGDRTLPAITLHASDTPKEHLNKYGQQYPLEKPKTY
jgi:plastocyanin